MISLHDRTEVRFLEGVKQFNHFLQLTLPNISEALLGLNNQEDGPLQLQTGISDVLISIF